MAKALDWSRCFVSVLFVDSDATHAYARARLAQRFLDATAEWNGLGKVIEAYACICTHVDEGHHADVGGVEGCYSAAKEFADNVGLDNEQTDQVLRKLGAGWSARLQDEDLRQHDVVVALDRVARDASAAQMQFQGLDPESGTLLLLSDFSWFFEANRDVIQSAVSSDGSGTAFLDDGVMRALRRCDFECASEANVASSAGAGAGLAAAASSLSAVMDSPSWPRAGALAEEDAERRPRGSSRGSPGEWRRLHCALLRGSSGLAWFLVTSWRHGYCNPLSH